MPEIIDAMPGFKFGADPELFVTNPDGVFVSAEGLIPGTKTEPYKVDFGAIQVDGMAAEFNIDPVEDFHSFRRNIKAVTKQLQGMLPPGYKLRTLPFVEFSKEVWDKSPECAKELGCSPDFNAWTGEVNPPPRNEQKPTLRTASGHLHIGWTDDADTSDNQHVMNCRDLVKQLDWYLGSWSLQIDPSSVRRSLYGKAGAMRFKPYGVEYRVLSNFWLTSDTLLIQVWNRMQKAIWDMRNYYVPDKAESFKFNELLIKSIDESQPTTALEGIFNFPIKTINPAHMSF